MIDKVIMNMFICDLHSDNWGECVDILRNIEFPTSVEASKGHSKGLGIQVLLDTDLEESILFSKTVLSKFLPEMPLIVLSDVSVELKDLPIGQWNDNDLVEPGRYFEELVTKEGLTGIFVFQNRMFK